MQAPSGTDHSESETVLRRLNDDEAALERLTAEIDLTRSTIAGLLPEAPSRPRPDDSSERLIARPRSVARPAGGRRAGRPG